jgi:hypothetical protein
MSCCGPEPGMHAHYGCCECGPNCCTPHGFARHFVSGKERQEHLKQYKEQLEKEIAGVAERLREIEGGKK